MQRSFSSLTLGLALIACGGGESSTSEASESPEGAAASTDNGCTDASGGFIKDKWVECAPLDTVEIALVNAGDGEKKELRLNAESGHTESNRMSMDISMSMGMGPMGQMDMDLPTMMIDMTTEVVETLPNGNIKSNITLSGIDVGVATGMMAGMEGELRATLQELVGLRGEMVMSATGFVLEGGFEAPANASKEIVDQLQSMNDSLGNSSVPVPSEAIGTGAVWETLMRDNSNGMDLVQHTRAELVEWDGEDAVIKSTLTQVLADMSPEMPDMPPGAEVSISSFDSKGTGNIRMRPGYMNPVDSTSEVELSMDMKVKAEGQEMDMAMKTAIEASFKLME